MVQRTGLSLRGVAHDLLFDAGIQIKTMPRLELLEHGGLVFLFERLLRQHKVAPRGILHIGGNVGQEASAYRMLGFEQVLFVEANSDPEVFGKLEQNISHMNTLDVEFRRLLRGGPQTRFSAVNIAAGNHHGPVPFYLMGSSTFSSTHRPLGFESWINYVVENSTPEEADKFMSWAENALKLMGETTVMMQTTDNVMRDLGEQGHPIDKYNILNLNIQGGELEGLRGASRTLQQMEIVQVEKGYVQHYEGSPSPEELDRFLLEAGFLESVQLRAGTYGVSFYTRNGSQAG
ncbi:MAG TPA: FkbM family methyltransferase [Candidatus Angelobacter sp.]|nr:FkbM family methyltransferase [Candidatus Angelobacter sp.]